MIMMNYLPEYAAVAWMVITLVAVTTYRKRRERGFLFLAFASGLELFSSLLATPVAMESFDLTDSQGSFGFLVKMVIVSRYTFPIFVAYGLFLLGKSRGYPVATDKEHHSHENGV